MSKIRFDILTLFPEFFSSPLQTSLVGKALKSALLEVNLVNIRDFGEGTHKSVDDSPYGGGEGMVLRADVLANCLNSIERTGNSKVVLLDPAGEKLTQTLVKELASFDQLILVAGRYEGVDQRFKDLFVEKEISIGDYILNGGEAAALVVVESVSRLISGVIGKEASHEKESFSPLEVNGKEKNLLEHPHYTRPVEFQGLKVPEILLSGNHEKIEKWRKEKSIVKTKKLRADLLG